MKIIIKKLGILIITLMTFLSVSAYDFEVDGIAYNIISTGDLTCQVARKEYSGIITIPEKVEFKGKSLTIVSLADECFIQMHDLERISLPNTIKDIPRYCFYYCYNLKKVQLPESLETIEEAAFMSCKSLVNIELPSSITKLAFGAFRGCTSLGSINLPQNLQIIEPSCFEGCHSLKNVSLASLTNIKELEKSTFCYCRSLESIVIPDWITKLGDSCFYGCSTLEDVSLPEGMTELEDGCFASCEKLTNLHLPNTIEKIGEGCFEFSGIKQINLKCQFDKIPAATFSHCYNLENLEIPETIKVIDLGYYSYGYSTFEDVPLKKLRIMGESTEPLNTIFSGDYKKSTIEKTWCPQLEELEFHRPITPDIISCPKLKTLILDYDTESIDNIVKQHMSELNDLNLLMLSSVTPPSAKEDSFSKVQFLGLTVVVPDEAVETYKNANVWRNFWNIISKSDYLAGLGVESNSVNEKFEVARYDCCGKKVDSDFSGIVIIRYSDGSTRKIIQK